MTIQEKKILFIGGTGNISTACSQLVLKEGGELFLLNRGNNKEKIQGARYLNADINDTQAVKEIIEPFEFDVVVNFIAFNEHDIERDFDLFKNKTKHYLFISSTSIYQKPLQYPIITETTPIGNPFWIYAQQKIKAEEKLNRLMLEHGFPATIVRPSLTYEYVIPIPIGGWKEYTVIKRIKEGKPIIVHGDGSSLWTITHSSDFAKGLIGLFGNEKSIGEIFHITSDEILTWNQIYESIAAAIGKKANLVHIASESICAVADQVNFKDMRGTLLGDKAVSVIFDNSKIKAFVPEFKAEISFRQGIEKTIQWFEADPSRYMVNPAAEEFIERLLQFARV